MSDALTKVKLYDHVPVTSMSRPKCLVHFDSDLLAAPELPLQLLYFGLRLADLPLHLRDVLLYRQPLVLQILYSLVDPLHLPRRRCSPGDCRRCQLTRKFNFEITTRVV